MRAADRSEFERMLFAVVPHSLDDGRPTVEIVWQPRPSQWRTVWFTAFPSVADRDIALGEMWQRQDRWTAWGEMALFAGAKALNQMLLDELTL